MAACHILRNQPEGKIENYFWFQPWLPSPSGEISLALSFSKITVYFYEESINFKRLPCFLINFSNTFISLNFVGNLIFVKLLFKMYSFKAQIISRVIISAFVMPPRTLNWWLSQSQTYNALFTVRRFSSLYFTNHFTQVTEWIGGIHVFWSKLSYILDTITFLIFDQLYQNHCIVS